MRIKQFQKRVMAVLAVLILAVLIWENLSYSRGDAQGAVEAYCLEKGYDITTLDFDDQGYIDIAELLSSRDERWAVTTQTPKNLYEKTFYRYTFSGRGFHTDTEDYQTNYNQNKGVHHSGLSHGYFVVVDNQVIGGWAYPTVAYDSHQDMIFGGGYSFVNDGLGEWEDFDIYHDKWNQELDQIIKENL